MNWLDEGALFNQIGAFLSEDLGRGDITTQACVARNHRLGLDDGVLIKDNHIALAGSVGIAVERAKKAVGHLHKIEVEVSSERDLREAITSGADILLLDNLAPAETRRMVELTRSLSQHVLLESSGGITLENVRAYAEAGVDLISIGALTHSARAMDISFKIQPGS